MKNWGAISQVNNEIGEVSNKIDEVKLKGVKIVTGPYTGDGGSGIHNARSLTFDFVPKFVMLVCSQAASSPDRGPTYLYGNYAKGLLVETLKTTYTWYTGFTTSPNDTSYGKRSEDSKTIYWYDDAAGRMFNDKGITYWYLAIG